MTQYMKCGCKAAWFGNALRRWCVKLPYCYVRGRDVQTRVRVSDEDDMGSMVVLQYRLRVHFGSATNVR